MQVLTANVKLFQHLFRNLTRFHNLGTQATANSDGPILMRDRAISDTKRYAGKYGDRMRPPHK
jgi:hypothetical protein